jgi:hypothetical protein
MWFALAMAAAPVLLAGCAHHTHKSKSYDKAISDEDSDPTYHEDPQRAGETVRDIQ